MKIKFCGAAQTVTGSQHLLEINGKKLLLDCGLYQGKRSDAYDINRNFLFEPAEIDSLILSHAHIDHSGNLPTLYKKGFRGDIYSTPATRDLSAIMLLDSAHIQEKDIEYVNKKRIKNGEEPYKPLYQIEDVKGLMKLFKSIPYHSNFNLIKFGDTIDACFIDAGHILGSAILTLNIKENGKLIRLCFTGDLGRPDLPILKDPEKIENVNYLISESTYGCRIHEKALSMEEQLIRVLKESISRKGKIIVPAFSVGRTQEFVYALSKLFNKGAIEPFPIYIDSPLSSNVTNVFRVHHECFDEETSRLLSTGLDVFGFSNLHYVRDVEESKSLRNLKGTCMIISASGMCESGRILHHLKNHIPDPTTTILIIGYQAENTLGRKLVDTKDEPDTHIKIFGDVYIKKAKTYVLNSFSAHADQEEILNSFKDLNKNEMELINLVHGEVDQQECLKNKLIENGFKNVNIPAKGDIIEI